MVYCGPPSKACEACRKRKIGCDEARPQCGQCLKRPQQCPGYRDIGELIFRNETKTVRDKVDKPRTQRKLNGRSKSKQQQHEFVQVPSTTPPLTLTVTSPPQTISSGASTPSPQMGDISAVLSVLKGRDIQATSPSEFRFEEYHGSRNTAGHRKKSVKNHADQPPRTIRSDLPWSVRERGTAYFFSRYVATDNGSHQHYDFIYDVWKPPTAEDDQVDCVAASVVAVGLVGLSKITKSHDTLNKAKESYTLALQLATAALKDPVEAVKDRTMLAILILGTYELMSGRTPQTLQAWKKHVNGAALLARMRGTAQFDTVAGRKMFLMLCHTVLVSCVQSGLPMPQPILELREKLAEKVDTKDPAWSLVDCICKAIQVRADVTSGQYKNTDEIVAQLCDVEKDFEQLVRSLPPSWVYQPIRLTNPHPGVQGILCHIYQGLYQATSWNEMRVMRMLIQEMIIHHLCPDQASIASLPPYHQAQAVKSLRLMGMLQESVAASVPQHFGIVSSKNVAANGAVEASVRFSTPSQPYQVRSSHSIPSKLADEDGPDKPAPRASPTMFGSPFPPQDQDSDAERFLTLATSSRTIIMPLYTMAMSSTCSHENMKYALDRLRAIYRETGSEQAKTVIGMIEAEAARPTAHQWAVMPEQFASSTPNDLPLVV